MISKIFQKILSVYDQSFTKESFTKKTFTIQNKGQGFAFKELEASLTSLTPSVLPFRAQGNPVVPLGQNF